MHQIDLSEMDAYALACIDHNVRRLIRNYGFTTDERDDLVQQLFLEYMERASQYDSLRSGVKTFVSCLVRNQAMSAARARKRALRRRQDVITDTSSITASETLDSSAEHLQFWLDVERALAPFPRILLNTARALCQHTPGQLGRTPGQSRNSVYRRMRRVRTAFLAAGIGPTYFAGGAR